MEEDSRVNRGYKLKKLNFQNQDMYKIFPKLQYSNMVQSAILKKRSH